MPASKSLLNSLSTISSLSLGTVFPLDSYKGHFCDIFESSMLTCLDSTVIGLPPKPVTTMAPRSAMYGPFCRVIREHRVQLKFSSYRRNYPRSPTFLKFLQAIFQTKSFQPSKILQFNRIT